MTRITYDKYTIGDNRGKKRKPKTYLKTDKKDKSNEYYQIYADDEDQTAIGEMDDDGDITFQYQGYDSETDRLHSEYPYEIVTEYQESPETIAKYKALQYANKALTPDQRMNGWEAEWNESRKEAYYFNRHHNEDESYESHGTETKLDDGYGTKYEPYDVNSLPNYNGLMGGPLPSNNSKKASIARSSVAASSVAAPSVAASSVAAPSDLPPGWTEQHSRTHNRPYWFNINTGAQSWTKPTSGGKKNRKSKRKLNKKSKRNTRRK